MLSRFLEKTSLYKLVAEKPDIQVFFISGYSPDIIGEDIEQYTNKFYPSKAILMQKLSNSCGIVLMLK
jgi:hypothetical protein